MSIFVCFDFDFDFAFPLTFLATPSLPYFYAHTFSGDIFYLGQVLLTRWPQSPRH